ncbi:hypothetical protein HYU95_01335 [Candidatus Daviesbacteria bacterium]|nr:hypothetical protein [Candidatus Daviesbacteria bacterium]
MSLLFPVFSLLISFLLGAIVTKRVSLEIPGFSRLFFTLILGIILFTSINYFSSLLFSFPKGIIVGQGSIIALLLFYLLYYYKPDFKDLFPFRDLLQQKLLLVCIGIIGIILIALFHTHIIRNIEGDLYTGESTFGDLPFHLSTISQIAYGLQFPPDEPMYARYPLVYPYFINFFSAILVYEGWSPRLSIIIPGLILSVSLLGLIYDFAFNLTKNSLKSFLTVIFYFFNGGLGFYFFLKDYSFNITSILYALSQASSLKEYSHLFEQNIQWGNFLSRMIVPERSLLFGIPAGIIILRLLFFRGTDKLASIFDLILAAFLISLMPLLHTHTVLAMMVILPVLALLTIDKRHWKNQLTRYFFVASLAVIFAIPHIPLFLNHLNKSESFFKLHLWWMAKPDESVLWFWFKNTYLFIPISLIILIFSKISNKNIRTLQLITFILLIIINVALFSPFDWDNVKFLFWAGLFFAIGAASFFGFLLQKNHWYIRVATIVIVITMISTALLSIWREIYYKNVLFSKEAVSVSQQLIKTTPPNSLLLTYKIHNSPVSNLAGRSIMMGYPGLLWVHGIKYQDREKEINDIYAGSADAKDLIEKYGIDYAVIESYNPQDMFINKSFFEQYPVELKTQNYTIYKLNEPI